MYIILLIPSSSQSTMEVKENYFDNICNAKEVSNFLGLHLTSLCPSFICSSTVWPQPIWIKVRTSWQIPLQHQSTYLGGSKSAWIEITPFRLFFEVNFQKLKISKIFGSLRIFFCFTIHKKLNKSCSLDFFFSVTKKNFFWKFYYCGPKGGISILVDNGPLGCYL